MFLLSTGTELEENKTSDKARNSAKTALAPIAETGMKKTHMHTQTYIHTLASRETGLFVGFSARLTIRACSAPPEEFIFIKLVQKKHTVKCLFVRIS